MILEALSYATSKLQYNNIIIAGDFNIDFNEDSIQKKTKSAKLHENHGPGELPYFFRLEARQKVVHFLIIFFTNSQNIVFKVEDK